MNNSRRTFMKTSAAAGIVLGSCGLSAKSYRRIIGANDRVVVGIVGFSDRAKQSLIPAFMAYADKLNFEIKGVSDIWNRRRREGAEFFKQQFGKNVVTYINNERCMRTKISMP